MTHLHVPIVDFPTEDLRGHLDTLCDFIHDALSEQQNKVLVHCLAGLSRSPAVVIAYLMKHHNMTFAEAHNFVFERRPMISPNNGFVEQLKKYEADLSGRKHKKNYISGLIHSLRKKQ